MRALRQLLPSVFVPVLVAATLSVVANPVAAAPAADLSLYPAGVTGGTFGEQRRLIAPTLESCAEPRPANQFITFPSYAQTAEQICGVWGLQNAAAAAYNAMHGYAEGDDVTVGDLHAQAGIVQNLLQQLAYAVAQGDRDVTATQRAAYDWFFVIQQHHRRTAAAEALREYRKWDDQQCHYRPPSTTIFGYNPSGQPVCDPSGHPGLIGLLGRVAPPTYANFVQYGRYDAERILGIAAQAEDGVDRTLIDNGIVAGSGAVGAVLAGAAPHVASTLQGSVGALAGYLRIVQPHNGAGWRYLKLINDAVVKSVRAATQAGRVVLGSQRVAAQMMRATADVLKTGARSLSGPMTIATVAITVAVMRGMAEFTAADIPRQLAADVAAAEPADRNRYVRDLLTADEGIDAPLVYANYRAQLQFPEFTVGVQAAPAVCADCVVHDEIPLSPENAPARIRVTALHPDGTPTGWSRIGAVADFVNTWGMGTENGAYGVPHVSVGIAGGRVWTRRGVTSPPTDESEAGLSGWLPSGQLRYFDPSGQPMIAYLHGEQFLTQTSPGSVASGGADAGNDCATQGQCTASSSIVVMGSGGTVELKNEITGGTFMGMECTANTPGTHDCLTDTLSPNGRLVPAGGTRVATSGGEVLEQQGTSRLYRLTIVPNRGTAPAVWVVNEHNTNANNKTNGVAPNGGLVAGETVAFVAPESSEAGYDTTYTWHVQTVCPDDPDHPAQRLQGMLVCSDSPSYGRRQLADDQQDLTSCVAWIGVCRPDSVLGVTWTPDPAFHDSPVTTLTGRDVEWTWPAPGTYHLRLVTRDQYGVTRSSDRDLVVSAASAPRSRLSWSAAADPQPRSVAPSVIGPASNGNALTVGGCVESPAVRGATSYSAPEVTVDWGDGAVDADVAVTRDGGSGCATPWRWEATHSYAVDTRGAPFVQVPVTVTTRDVTFPATRPADLPPGTRTSASVTVHVNVHAPELPPSFVGGTTATYGLTAGVSSTVVGAVTSVPGATITRAPAEGVTHQGATCAPGLPSGVGFQASADGRFEITGTPRVDAGGCYALTVSATNPHGTTDQRAVVTVAQEPAITSAASAGWSTAQAAHAFTVATAGFPAPRLRVGAVRCTTGCGSSLPHSVTFYDRGDGTATLSTDRLSGDDTGVYEVTLEAESSSGTTSRTLTLTVDGPPVFTGPASTGFATGRAGTAAIGVSSATPVTLTCRVPGSDDRCRSGDGSRPFVSADLAQGTGLSLVGSTITGIPTVPGAHPVTLTATNGVGTTTQELTILVSASGGASITMVPTSGDNLVSYTPGAYPSGVATFLLDQAGSVTLCSNVPGDTVRTETVAGGQAVATPLPTGLSITRTGNTRCPAGQQQLVLGGTPTAPHPGSTGDTAYRLVDDANGLALLTLRLVGAPVFSSPDRAAFTAGEPGTFTAAIGTLRYANGSYSRGCVTGASGLPAGLTFAGGPAGTATISGVPEAGGASTVTLTGSDCQGRSTEQRVALEVAEAPVIASGNSAGFRVGAGGSFTVRTGATSYPVPRLQVSGLPDGAAFADHGDGTGTLTVEPTAPATDAPVALEVTATSSSGTDTQQLRLAVGEAPRVVSPPDGAALTLPVGAAASYTVETSGVPAAALTTGDLPPGLTLTDHGDGTAVLAGRPMVAGDTEVTLVAENGVGAADRTTLRLVVTQPAAFVGTTTGASCTGATDTVEHVLVAATDAEWRLCGRGSPVPEITLGSVTCAGEAASLPPGLTFTDHGDGSASIDGAAAIGSGAACPGGYTATVAFANAGGTVVKQWGFTVREVLELASPSTTEPFVPGAPNVAEIGAAGSPLPSFAVDASSPLPGWLSLVDQGNGIAVLSGQPPASAAGSTVTFGLRVTNGQAAPLESEMTVPVSEIGLAAATPPPALLGTPYSYRFEAPDGVEVGLAEGGALPRGLALSASGVLAGTPEELGRFPVPLTLTRGDQVVTTGTVELHVGVGDGALMISQFRTLDPSDWFVQVVNTTDGPVELTGWTIGLQPPGESEAIEVPLGTGVLGPGETAAVTTPLATVGTQLGLTDAASGAVVLRSGFKVVAPNGAVTDAVGVSGALPDLREGPGVSYPVVMTAEHLRYAFVRRGFADGNPVDTGDNAADLTFVRAVGLADPPEVGVGFDVTAPVYGQPVTAGVTVTAPGAAPAGTVQFVVDGLDVGSPVSVAGGTARSAPLGVRAVGDHVVTAEFRPSTTGVPAVGRATLTVRRAATRTTPVRPASGLSATVAPVAPGAGVPTGTVTFRVGGTEVGTAPLVQGRAVLARSVPAGPVAASYAGDASFAASSGSATRRDPTISARLTSAKPRNGRGWFRRPVRVTFTCAPGGAPLAGACPGPVTVRREGAAQTVTRTVTATDGGRGTVTVRIRLDRSAPRVRLRGVRAGGTYDASRPPRVRCVARDAVSGVARCRVTRVVRGTTVRYAAVAVDRAGNVGRHTVVVRVRGLPGPG